MKNCNSFSVPSKLGVKLIRNLKGKSIDCRLYKQLVESLMYLTATRLDIMHVMNVISRYMDCPKEVKVIFMTKIYFNNIIIKIKGKMTYLN